MTPNAGEPRTHPSLGDWAEVRPGVHVLAAEPDTVNLGLVVGTERCLVIDTGSSPAQGRAVREAVARVTDVPLAGALVTHDHHDHWWGLAAFADLETWGHESLAEERDSPALATRVADAGLAVDDLHVPSTAFSLATAIDLGGGVRVEALHLGQAHSRSDVFVLVPGANVLFTGDLVELAGDPESPWFGDDSSPQGWPSVLNMAMGFIDAETVVVPGHGRIGGRDDLVAQMGALAQIPFEADRLVREGVRFEQAAEAGEWPLPWDHIEAGVRTAYAELDALGVRARLPLTRAGLGD